MNYGADLYEDYEYSKKLLRTVSGAGEVRLISSAYCWARPAILVAGKGRGGRGGGGMFPFLLFLHFHSCSFLPRSSTISPISFLPFSGRRHKMTHKG